MAKAKDTAEAVGDTWDEVNSLVALAIRQKLAKSKRWANVQGVA